uniref:Helicase-associated domain-containing protein n=1 Tax=Peronospora matthiolae TaxID=2874970 RepID=A0AAV1TRQ3_9STRA
MPIIRKKALAMPRRRLLQFLGPSSLSLPLVPPAARFDRVFSSTNSSVSARHQPSANRSRKARNQLVLALRTFHALEEHFAVPFGFVVPRSDQWPPEVQSMPLGVKVHRFVQTLNKNPTTFLSSSASENENKANVKQVQELQALGFPLYSWQAYQFQQVCLPALKTYAELFGHLFVPQKFVVPDRHNEPDAAAQWPRATHGYKLGLVVAKMRKQVQQEKQREQQLNDSRLQTGLSAALPCLPKSQVDALNELGFVWRVRDTKWYKFFLPGLRRYRELHGHADVPLTFTIPSHDKDPRWPKTLAGYKLGRHVTMVRAGNYTTQVRDSKKELEDLGFSFRVLDKVWKESIFPALKVFSEIHSHCDVWQEFVVPSNEPWPQDSWGLKLGVTVKNIRRGAFEAQTQASRKELDALGFVWNARQRIEATVRSVVIPALTTHRRLHGNNALVTTDFVVPDRDPNWPVHTRGFKLGRWITRVRSGKVALSPKLRAELDEVGFVWRSTDQRWHDVILPAFQAYASLHGGSCASMSTKFFVPPEAPYPRAAWGVNLGGALWHIRNGDSYVNCEAKRREMRALGILVDSYTA